MILSIDVLLLASINERFDWLLHNDQFESSYKRCKDQGL